MKRVTYFNSGVKVIDILGNWYEIIQKLVELNIYEFMIISIECIPEHLNSKN